jgi:hypothetical protein
MSRGRQRIAQTDLTKTLKAVAAAQVSARVVIDGNGQISVYVTGTVQSQLPPDDPNEWATDDSH